jgi:hypothetical protein
MTIANAPLLGGRSHGNAVVPTRHRACIGASREDRSNGDAASPLGERYLTLLSGLLGNSS